MQAVLETERLVLRRFTGEDVDNLVELDSDPEVMRFITGGRPSSREEIEKLIMPAFLGYDERFGGFGFWAAVEKVNGSIRRLVPPATGRRRPPTRSSSATGSAGRSGKGLCD